VKPERCHLDPGEFVRQRADGIAVDLHGRQEPSVPSDTRSAASPPERALAHSPHLAGERADGLEHCGLLEVAQYVVAIPDGRDVVHRSVEEGLGHIS